jgi:hypothetical protein
MDKGKLLEAIKLGNIEWRKHILERLVERKISQESVINVLTEGKQIEDYPDDKPFPCALFLGFIDEQPLHVVVALDKVAKWVYIITAYEPNLEYFESDFKTRRKK